MSGPTTICPEQFKLCHATVLAASDRIQQGLSDLQAPFSQSLLYSLRRRCYKIEKITKSLSLTLLPTLAFELEALLGEMANAESAELGETLFDETEAVPLLLQGLQQINQGMQALARGEQEASSKSVVVMVELVNKLRTQRAEQDLKIELTPSDATVTASNDELDSFERSLTAMQQELQSIVANKPSAKEGWLNKVVDSIKLPK